MNPPQSGCKRLLLTSGWPKAVFAPLPPPWYLLYCLPCHEVRAALDLERRGFTVYLPSTSEKRSRPRQKPTTYERPIFSRYLFARFPYADRWRVLMTPGIAEIVRVGDEPAMLTDPEVNEVRALEAQLRAPTPVHAAGDVVTIQVGKVTLRGTVTGHKHGQDILTLRKAA